MIPQIMIPLQAFALERVMIIFRSKLLVAKEIVREIPFTNK
jgi:hypothetical protein